MMRGRQAISRTLCLAVAMAFPCAIAHAQPRVASACVDLAPGVPPDTLKALSRGVNLAGWMDGPGSPAPSVDLLRTLRKAGMSHVRLPVPAESVMRRFSSEHDLQQQLPA